MPATDATPYTDHLWQLGFTIKAKADRLAIEIADDEGNTFRTNFEITAYPERGEARRLFAARGPAKSEVKNNLAFEDFLAEQEQGRDDLRKLYTEICAKHLFEMLKAQVPTLSKPAAAVA